MKLRQMRAARSPSPWSRWFAWAVAMLLASGARAQPSEADPPLDPVDYEEQLLRDEDGAELDPSALSSEELAIRRNLAYGLLTEGEYASAWPHVETLLQAGDDAAWLHLSAAQICLYWLVDYECVEREAARAIELRPENARAHMLLGQLAEDQGDDARALEHYRESLARRGSLAEVSTRLAGLLADEGDVYGAIEVLQDALEFHPRDARLYLTLARLLESVDPQSAEDAYVQATYHHDEPVVAWGHLLRFYERQGRRSDAARVRRTLDGAVERRTFRPIR